MDGEAFALALAAAEKRGWIEKADDGRISASRRGRIASGWEALESPPLRSAMRRNRVKGPTSAEFDPEALKAFVEDSNVSSCDLRLVTSALWIAVHSKALREIFPVDHASLGGAASTLMAVATMNRAYATARRKNMRVVRRSAHKGRGRLIDPGVLPRFDGAGGQSVTIEDVVEAAVDAGESWLYAASKVPVGGAWPEKADHVALRAQTRYELQRGLNVLWQQALWEGWNLDSHEGHSVWVPADEPFALLFDAWQARGRSNLFQYSSIAIASWPAMSPQARRARGLPLSVVRAEGGRGRSRRRLLVEPPVLNAVPPTYFLEREALTGSYLADFLARPLPKQPDLDCELLLKAWHVLADLAEALAATANFDDFATLRAVGRSALCVRIPDVVDVLERSLGCGKPTAEHLAAFLTWRSNAYKGLWGCPLVPVPGGDEVCLARPVLLGSNPIRRTEIWLQNGGLNDDLSSAARGDAYEAGLRAQCRDAIAGDALLTDARCAPNAIKKTADFPEQIDLLVQLGDLLLVCEVKCFLFPADSRERLNYMEKLADAAEQAKRKAKALALHADASAKALGLADERAGQLRVVPLVVVNQEFGVSYDFDDCLVVDARFLLLYLGSGTYVPHSVIAPKGTGYALGSSTLYNSQTESAKCFEDTLRDPPTLSRFVDRLKWEPFPVPTQTGEPLLVMRTILKEPGADERSEAERVAALAGF